MPCRLLACDNERRPVQVGLLGAVLPFSGLEPGAASAGGPGTGREAAAPEESPTGPDGPERWVAAHLFAAAQQKSSLAQMRLFTGRLAEYEEMDEDFEGNFS